MSASIVWIYLRWSDYNFSFKLFCFVFLFYAAENVGGLGGKAWRTGDAERIKSIR